MYKIISAAIGTYIAIAVSIGLFFTDYSYIGILFLGTIFQVWLNPGYGVAGNKMEFLVETSKARMYINLSISCIYLIFGTTLLYLDSYQNLGLEVIALVVATWVPTITFDKKIATIKEPLESPILNI